MASPHSDAAQPWWARSLGLSKGQIDFVERVWLHFASHRSWPTKKQVIRDAESSSVDPDSLLAQPWVWIDRYSNDAVRPSLEALLCLKDVRELLGPVPEILRLACARFLASPNYHDRPPPHAVVAFSEVARLWTTGRAELALALMCENGMRQFVSWTNPTVDAAYFRPDFQVIAFRATQTLEEVCAAADRGWQQISLPLGGSHLGLVKAIWAHVLSHLEWPQGGPFAVDHFSDLGNVPVLVNELVTTRITENQFSGHSTFRLVLNWRSISTLGLEQMALKLVRSLGKHYAKFDENLRVTDLAKLLDESETEIAALLLVLQWEEWIGSHTLAGPLQEWTLQVKDEARRFRGVSSWAGYVELAHPGERQPPVELNEQPHRPKSIMRSMVPPTVFKQNTKVGPWRLQKFLGSGGQGEVWSVRHTTEKHVPERALKACFSDEAKGQARFVREIELLKQCEHQHVLKLHASESTWGMREIANVPPFAFFVGEICDGSFEQQKATLGNLLARLDLFKQACAGVGYLHSLADPVIHRDIKPGNFLLAREPKRVVLADFGVARPLGSEQNLTGTQEIVGTRNFRAPEILAGGEGTALSDVFSLGRLLEWLLTGDVSQELSEVRTVPRGAEVAEEACAALDGVIRKATAVRAVDRFPSVQSMVEALPGLQVSVRANPPASQPTQLQHAPFGIRASVLDLAKSNDVVGWRDLESSIRRAYPKHAKEWEAGFHAYDMTKKEGRFAAADGLFEAALPRVALALAGLYTDNARFIDHRQALEDLVCISGWPKAGLTRLVEAPCFNAYAFHHLHGALCCHLKRIDCALNLVETEVSTPMRREPLRSNLSLVGYPGLFEGDIHQGWEFLRRTPDRFPVVAEFFALREDFEVALASYSMLLSLLELAYDSQKLSTSPPAAVKLDPLSLCPPPLFAIMEVEVIATAARRTFGDRDIVRQVAEHASSDVNVMRQLWSAWAAACNGYRRAVSHNNFFLNELPLGALG